MDRNGTERPGLDFLSNLSRIWAKFSSNISCMGHENHEDPARKVCQSPDPDTALPQLGSSVPLIGTVGMAGESLELLIHLLPWLRTYVTERLPSIVQPHRKSRVKRQTAVFEWVQFHSCGSSGATLDRRTVTPSIDGYEVNPVAHRPDGPSESAPEKRGFGNRFELGFTATTVCRCCVACPVENVEFHISCHDADGK
ncbi:hypothetical protein PM082_000822 [Marasmius tenuissimus]|nr:hypothetical protein PM082_000822 [Marasmius tenuissimus]